MRAERNRAGYSQDELAEKMGICAGKHIGTIERGETNPSLITIIAVMQALDISFDKLFEIKISNVIKCSSLFSLFGATN